MDFKDWRQSTTQPTTEETTGRPKHLHGRRYTDYIEEQITEAQARGAFENLPGMGKPLQFDDNPYAGEKALSYSLLKNNGYAPAEVELSKEIRQKLEQLNKQRDALSKRGSELRKRQVAPFASEKRAYNHAVTKALREYEASLNELNRKILTLNLSTPAIMHRVPLKVEPLLNEFREICPLFS